MGFTGTVTLAAVSDGADWSAALDNATLTIASGGTATAKLTVAAMGDTAALTGNVKVTATYSGPGSDASVAMTFNPILDVKFGDNGTGNAVYDTNLTRAPRVASTWEPPLRRISERRMTSIRIRRVQARSS